MLASTCFSHTWLLQLCRLCSPNPFKGITTVTLGKSACLECSSSWISWQRKAKLLPSFIQCFICLISLFLSQRRKLFKNLNYHTTIVIKLIAEKEPCMKGPLDKRWKMIQNTSNFLLLWKFGKKYEWFSEMFSIFFLYSVENFLTHHPQNFIPWKTQKVKEHFTKSLLFFPTSDKN